MNRAAVQKPAPATGSNPTARRRRPPPKRARAIDELLAVMARLRAPDGCPWDREQDHRTLRQHAVEEVYELMDAIEAGDDEEMAEELGDLLLQVVFHCQMANERGAFDFDGVARRLVTKLIHRHPHVFGDAQACTAAAVWEQWDRLKHVEKKGTRHERASALDGIPAHLPALMRVQKLWKKASRARLTDKRTGSGRRAETKRQIAEALFGLASVCQDQGWSAEELLRAEAKRRERQWRREETRRARQHHMK